MKKQKMRAQQFEEEYKNKGRKKKPMKKRVFGPVWMADQETGSGAVMEVACEQLIRILKPYRAINLLQGGGQIPTARSSPAPSPSEAAASAKVRLHYGHFIFALTTVDVELIIRNRTSFCHTD